MLPRWLAALCLWLLLATGVRCEETLPPAPQRHFNDYAEVLSVSDARQFDQRLARYEQETTNQFVVALFPKLETRSSLEDYTRRVMNAWKVGQADKNNGVVLFVFIKDRKMRIQVGSGLTSVLSDAFCKRILDEKLTPAFRGGDYAQGLRAAVDAVILRTTEPKTAKPVPAEASTVPAEVESTNPRPAPTPRVESVRIPSPSLFGSLAGGLSCFVPFIFLAAIVVFIVNVAGKFGGGPYRSRYDSTNPLPPGTFSHHDSSGGFSSSDSGSSGGGSSDSGFSGGGGSSDGGGGASGGW